MKKILCFPFVHFLLAYVSLAKAQGTECGYYYTNGTKVETSSAVATISLSVQETIAPNTSILTLTFKPDQAKIDCSSESKYLTYNILKPTLQLNVIGKLNEDYDEGLLATNPPSGICTLPCPNEDTTFTIVILANPVQVISVNDNTPQFNEKELELTIDETTPPNVDILAYSNKLLYAYDNDYDETGNDALLTFSVDNENFVVLPSLKFSYPVNDIERTNYIPRVGLKAPWSRRDISSTTFNLIAEDQGNPKNSNSIPITVNITPADLKDPKFLQDYYTAVIDSLQQAGDTLEVKPEPVKAVDGDVLIDEEIDYAIIDYDTLSLELIPLQGGGVNVKLNSPVVPSQKKVAYVVIEATQRSNIERADRVVLAVELPLEAETTTTSTTTESTTGTTVIVTCPPCTTSSPTTCPSCPTCPSCISTTTPAGTCPTSPSCESTTTLKSTCPSCPTCSTDPTEYTSTTNHVNSTSSTSTKPSNPVDNITTHSTSMSLSTEGTSSVSVQTSNSGTCPPCSTTTSSLSSITTTGVASTTQGSNSTPTDCPVVTCPTTTACPTHPPCLITTCPPCDCASTTSSSIVPNGTTNAIADCTTKFPDTTTTTSPSDVIVAFQKDQYASELIENSAIGAAVLVVQAVSSDGSSKISYSLLPEEDSRYFTIDENTGSITLASSLQKGSYVFHAQASLPTGIKGSTTVRVDVIQGYVIGEMHFGSPHYKFHIDERSAIGTPVGVVELRNPSSGMVPNIMSVDPASMTGYFYLKWDPLQSGIQNVNIFVNQTFNRQFSGPRVVLDISASATRAFAVSTIVDIEINDVNEDPLFKASQPLIIGYPARTYFDPAVSMPIFTFKASDPDEGDNAALSYHLDEKSNSDFDIDANNGHLFVKGLNTLTSTDQNLTITVKDLPGSSTSLQFRVRSLKNDEVHVITASGSETLSDETIGSDLTIALGYNVVVLHKVKTAAAKQLRLDNYDYTVNVYAVEKGEFVSRDKFEKDLKTNASTITGWAVTSQAVKAPEIYEPDNLISDVEAYVIATAVLATVLGLILLLIAGYLLFFFKNQGEMPWNRLRNQRKRTSDTEEKDQNLGNTYARSSDSSNSEPGYLNQHIAKESREASPASSGRTTEFSRDTQVCLSGDDSEAVKGPDTSTANKSNFKLASLNEEAYCPPTPTPKKSILKEVYQHDKEGEKGVSFDPTPEVIKVASTLQLDEETKSESSSDESDDADATVL